MRLNYTLTDHPLSRRGRFSRLSHLAWGGLLSLIALFAFTTNALIVVGKSANANFIDHPPSLTGLFWPSFIVLIVFIYFSTVFIIRRLHDLNMSGWFSLIVYLPVIGSLFWLYLVVAHGSTERNRYGRPRETTVWEGIFGLLFAGVLFGSLLFSVIYVTLNPSADNMHILNQAFKAFLGL